MLMSMFEKVVEIGKEPKQSVIVRRDTGGNQISPSCENMNKSQMFCFTRK